mgnify:CR=1 FL=1
MPNHPALEITDLRKTYATGVQALKGVSLTVAPGDFYALLGPNGAGKSTLIGVVSSLVNKTSGDVKVFGIDLHANRSEAMRQIGLVPQEINFNMFEQPFDICVNYAGFYGIPRAEAEKRAEEELKKAQLWDKARTMSRTLSGGMKRRLMIARAMMTRPKLLILDEPTAGVDIEIRRGMWKTLKEVNAAGTTVILTTHYLEEAENLCRNLAIIDRGRIIEQGPMRSLLAKLDVEGFLLDIDGDLPATLPAIPGATLVAENTHLRDEHRYLAQPVTTEHDRYGSGVMEHDMQVGDLLKKLETMGVLDNTIIVYSTDNGPEHSARLHGGTTPFRGEKMTTYEGGVRVPMMVRWPGKIPAGQVLEGIQAHMDIFTTLAAAAGEPNVAEKLRKEQKQYIDGVNNLDYWTGKAEDSARNHVFHYNESKLTALRMGPWKWHFSTNEDYYGTMVGRSKPMVFNIRMDPFESYDNSDSYGHLIQKVAWQNGPLGELMKEHLTTLAQYPPVQGGKSFDMSNVVEQFMSKGHD